MWTLISQNSRSHSPSWFSPKPKTWLTKGQQKLLKCTHLPLLSCDQHAGIVSPFRWLHKRTLALGFTRRTLSHKREELSDPAQPSSTSTEGSKEYPGAGIVAEQLEATRQESWTGHKQGRNPAGSELPKLFFLLQTPRICKWCDRTLLSLHTPLEAEQSIPLHFHLSWVELLTSVTVYYNKKDLMVQNCKKGSSLAIKKTFVSERIIKH